MPRNKPKPEYTSREAPPSPLAERNRAMRVEAPPSVPPSPTAEANRKIRDAATKK
ncbi:MAG TPA: hypothetical protein P5244_07000 [Syntrophales bacterium]|nr:hypothetical protein [Syntrophales bacterium]